MVVVKFRGSGGREADVDTPGHDLIAVATALADAGRSPLAAKLLALATGVLPSRTLSINRASSWVLIAVDRVRDQLQLGLEWDQLTTPL